MEDIKRILVVSRSTVECKKALHYGVTLAKAFSAELFILHIEYDPFEKIGFHHVGSTSLSDFQEQYRVREKQIRQEIDALVRYEMAEGTVVSEMVEKVEPLEQTLRAIEKDKIDLIIMAAHEEGRIERMIYGRSTHELIRKLPCSIMFVKGE
jgi:universal stress protein A